ncbi:unnamed protein product [Linum trigynum]|uniref:RST domain-containing protein n=1 Tax=Linum trigynum TaxID=586398 RepID=A0AAV2GKE0_9ROSI
MDPSIMKLLEEDEDETMHSGADVEAFQAALNRDIEGHASNSQNEAHNTVLPSESDQGSSQKSQSWPSMRQDQVPSGSSNQGPQNVSLQQQLSDQQQQQQQPQQSPMKIDQQSSVVEKQQQLNDVPRAQNPLAFHKNQPPDEHQQVKVEHVPVQPPQTSGAPISDKNPAPAAEPGRLQNRTGESQFVRMPPQITATEQSVNSRYQGKHIPFVLLLPALKPHLDKDREMQLQTIFNKLKKNEIPKDQFVRLMRNIVGDQVIKLALTQWQQQHGTNQSQSQAQALARQPNARMPVSPCSSQLSSSNPSALHQKGSSSSTNPTYSVHSSVKLQSDHSTRALAGTGTPNSRQVDSRAVNFSQMPSSNVNPDRDGTSISTQGHNKQQQQQQHLHFPQTSFPVNGGAGSNYPTYSASGGTSLKPQPSEQQTRQIPHHQSAGNSQVGTHTQAMSTLNVPKLERQSPAVESNGVQRGPISPYPSKPTLQQNSVPCQTSTNKDQNPTPFSPMNSVKPEIVEQAGEQPQKSQFSNNKGSSGGAEQRNTTMKNSKNASDKQLSSVRSSSASDAVPPNAVSRSVTTQTDHSNQGLSRIPAVTSPATMNSRTPPKKPSVGQKKPLEAVGSSPAPASKKQKVSGALSDKSIDQLNDVTAVSGVNIQEEEEQLFSTNKEDSRVSEASRRVVQEEEERLLLQKTPLQKKVAEIMTKCGMKNASNDVEKCLSLSVEERMRSLINNMIRMSKQRIDLEKSSHRTVVTSDVRQQLVAMNQKAKDEWDRKLAEAEKLRRVNEPDADDGAEGDKEKEDGRGKAPKVSKEEDDKLRTTAANMAARAAVGGDDLMSKWQLMSQARQKREGGQDGSRKAQSFSGRNGSQDGTTKRFGSGSFGGTKFGRSQVAGSQLREVRSLTIKDVIAVMEREAQLSKSALIYKLYERIRSDPPPG